MYNTDQCNNDRGNEKEQGGKKVRGDTETDWRESGVPDGVKLQAQYLMWWKCVDEAETGLTKIKDL